MTQHHVRARNDVWIECIGADDIDCEAFGNCSHLASSRSGQFSKGKWGCRVVVGGLLSVAVAPVRLGVGGMQLVEQADSRCENHARMGGMGESIWRRPGANRGSWAGDAPESGEVRNRLSSGYN